MASRFFILLVCAGVAVGQSGAGSATHSVCDVLGKRADWQGKTVRVAGVLIAGEGVFIGAYGCEAGLEINGQWFPAMIALMGSTRAARIDRNDPLSIARLRNHEPMVDVVVTVEGQFEAIQSSEASMGFGHGNEAPAEVTGWRVVEARQVKSVAMTVCEVIQRRRELDGKTVVVRGEVSDSEVGAFLRAHDCSIEVMTGGRIWPPAVWLTSRVERKARAGDSAPFHSPWEERINPARIWTVTGQLKVDYAGAGERGAFIGELVVDSFTHPEEILRSKLPRLKQP